MSANFSLSLVNPAVTSGPTNVAYTNGVTGNTLELILTNDFGFDLTFGGSSTGKYLQLSISTNVMDEEDALKLTVESPWTITFVPPPASLPSNARNAAGLTFHLFPPTGGVDFPDSESITITLQNLRLFAVGTGQVSALYAFDTIPSDDLNVSANLSVLAPYDPQLAALFGTNNPLMLTPYVNGGDVDNPIMVSGPPVTTGSAVDNLLHLNMAFQQIGNNGALVQQWDTTHPPTFRVSFPYFNGNSGLPAPLDLTDTLTAKDANYNALTSAWNFPMTLDPNNPKVTNNGFWQVALDPDSVAAPVWMVTPTPANVNLFTAEEDAAAAPGPVLDLYLLDIVSGLPIDPANPETLLYFQWNDFPGFNDGSLVYPLQKTPLTIDAFQGSLARIEGEVILELTWDTSGGGYCLVSGDTHELSPSTPDGQPYRVTISVGQPLLGAYTLTLVSLNGTTQVSRTIAIQWQVNTEIAPIEFTYCGLAQISPGGSTLYLPTPEGMLLYDMQTLSQAPTPPLFPPNPLAIYPFAAAPNGSALYIMNGSNPNVYVFDPANLQAAPLAGAGIPFASAMGVASNSSLVAVITIEFTSSGPLTKTIRGGHLPLRPGALVRPNVLRGVDADENIGANQLWLLNNATAQPTTQSPLTLPATPVLLAIGPQTGNYYITTGAEPATDQYVFLLDIYDSATGQPVGSPMTTDLIGVVAISPDETSLYTLSTAAGAEPFMTDFYLSKIDLGTMTYQQRVAIDTGFVLGLEVLIGAPWASLALSPDGAFLFLTGINPEALVNKEQVFEFAVYETSTMQPVDWPIPVFSQPLPYAITMSPDGSRIIAMAAQGPVTNFGNIPSLLYAIDPVFA